MFRSVVGTPTDAPCLKVFASQFDQVNYRPSNPSGIGFIARRYYTRLASSGEPEGHRWDWGDSWVKATPRLGPGDTTSFWSTRFDCCLRGLFAYKLGCNGCLVACLVAWLVGWFVGWFVGCRLVAVEARVPHRSRRFVGPSKAHLKCQPLVILFVTFSGLV